MRGFKKGLAFIFTLALLAVPFVIYFKAQAITDWWQLRGYTPPPAISALAQQDTMTAYAKHVFYVNHPKLESNISQFRIDCAQNEKTIVLGCYHSDQDGIFMYDVRDSRLSGVEQVTAAHEMLHAAYDRMSRKDRHNVDDMLQDYYNHGLQDQRVKDTINLYRQTEPDAVVNEMHSIFGTEVANLPPALEAHYQKYFTNRQAVVNFANDYQSEFTSRLDQIHAYDSQLAQLKSQIEAEEAALSTQLQQIQADRVRVDTERNSGQIDQYNADAATFNAEVAAYNNGVDKLKNDIENYNSLVVKRNAIARDLASLDQAIDTRLKPQTVR